MVTALVVSPIGGIVHGGWSVHGAVRYLDQTYLLRVYEFNVGATLHGAPFPDVWDASLWTLCLKFLCYLIVGVLYFVPVIRRNIYSMAALFVLGTAAAVLHDRHELPHSYGATAPLFLLLPYLLAGAAAAQAGEKLRLHRIGAPAAVIILAVQAVTHTVLLGAPAPLTYLLLYLGHVLPAAVTNIGARATSSVTARTSTPFRSRSCCC